MDSTANFKQKPEDRGSAAVDDDTIVELASNSGREIPTP